MPMHPQAEAYLDQVAEWWTANDLPAIHRMQAPRAREVYSRLSRELALPREPMELAEDHEIQARSGPLRVRILRPATGREGPLPVALYFHGGGYVIGGIDEGEHEARRIAARMPAVVVAASYRLAPEHPFPAAVEDAYDALVWTAHNARRYGGDPGRLMVGGCSAGGGVAAAATRLAVRENGPVVALLYLLCPWLDLTLREPSVSAFAAGHGLDYDELQWFATLYLGTMAEAADPLISPALHPPPPGMPPTVILAAECDPLRDEAQTFAERLEAAGATVVHHVAPGMIHGFNTITHFIPEGERYLKPVEAAMRRLIRGDGVLR